MKTAFAALAALTLLGARPTARPATLELKVITGSPEGFLVNATLITGARDAVLIDAAFTRPDARRIVSAIRASGKNLTTVYVTHDHPDHYFGLEVIHQAFPNARFVALSGAVAEITRTARAKVAQWKPLYGDSITSNPVIPTALTGSSITLEGERLDIVGPVQGDDAVNSFVWIPSLKAVVTGDIVYSGVYVWTAETDTAARRRWAATLDRIAALHPAVVVPGHQQAALGTTPASVAFTKEYLAAFDQALAGGSTPADLEAKVKARYPSLALDIILKIGAEAALPASATSAAPCDRACLLEHAKQFNANLLAHTSEKIPLAANANIRENTMAIALGESKWIRVTKILSEGVYADPILGNVIEHVAAETADGKTVYIGTRLKLVDGKIQEVEINFDDGPRVNIKNLVPYDPIFNTIVPPEARSTREALTRIITSYFQGLTDHNPIQADYDPRCDRYHSGNRVTHNPRNGVEEGADDGCYESNLGPKPWGPATEVRIGVVDPERGIVIGYAILYYGNSARRMQINEVFKILDGRLRMVDNIGLMQEGITTSGFTK